MISLQFFMCYQGLIYADVILIATIAANPFGRNRMRWQLSPKYLIVTLVATAAAGTAVRAQTSVSPAVVLAVDERQAARRIAFVHEDIAAAPGSLTLAYPRWIPGEHGPTGPIQQVGNLRIRSGSTVLSWTRDPDDIYNIRVNVPPGGDHISVDFDALAVNTVSDHQLLVAWNTVVLYPRGVDKRNLLVEASILLPANWKQASALHLASQSESRVNFAPVSLERLIDSPVLAGEFFRAVPLASDWPAELDITGDSRAAVDAADDAHAFDLFAKLVAEDRAMFGFRHWPTFHILVSQSAARPFDGLEHGDSAYNAVPDAALSKKDQLQKFGWPLLAHEQSHSWDGKYRRPAELYSKPDYQGPERTSLLWVYEGLNEYIGMLLASRAGFNDQDYMRDYLARVAADFSHKAGRGSTSLVDTATENWVLRAFDVPWYSIRRGQDYYDEGALIWLRVDTIIRERTQGKRSLDDFLRSFFGQRDTDATVVPYTREDVESSLAEVCPNDWHRFFEEKIYQVNSKPPTDGLEAAGWRLVYSTTPNNEPFYTDVLPITYFGDYSIGISIMKDGSIFDVVSGTPAYEAGLGPNMTILSVDGHVYAPEVLNEAIAHPQNGKILLTVRNFNSVEVHEVNYSGGVRFPHLEQIPGAHDTLSEILAPRS
jgi:predicted metalloprotease with PDZ domain